MRKIILFGSMKEKIIVTNQVRQPQSREESAKCAKGHQGALFLGFTRQLAHQSVA